MGLTFPYIKLMCELMREQKICELISSVTYTFFSSRILIRKIVLKCMLGVKNISVVTDSEFTIKCATKRIKKWKTVGSGGVQTGIHRRGFINPDQLKALDEIVNHPGIKVKWVSPLMAVRRSSTRPLHRRPTRLLLFIVDRNT